jgi:long-chain acyl-CoA synthetase
MLRLDQKHTVDAPLRSLAGRSKTVADMFLRRVEIDARRAAWKTKQRGHWISSSWTEVEHDALAVATWLLDRGIAMGDKVCIVGPTKPAWCICDLGGQLAGAVTLGAYPTLSPPQLAYVVDHSDSKVLFAGSADEVNALLAHRAEIPKLERIVVWDPTGLAPSIFDDGFVVLLDQVLATEPRRDEALARVAATDPKSTAILIYTSGTTGPPKGAMISHENILACLDSHESMVEFDRDDIILSFLPMAHAAERVLGFYGRVATGLATAFASSIPKVLEEVREVRPTIFGSVPRIFEKAYSRMLSEVERASPGKQRVFSWASKVGREVVRRWQNGERIPLTLELQYRLADRIVFSKIRAVFGGRVRYFVTGAAPISLEILEFFWAAGLRIYEVYGMTEATVVTHLNRPGGVKLGSVGKPLACVEQRIADDGEVLLKGPVVFQGYYKDEDATREAIDADGWLHTGDVGRLDRDGYLTLFDRKKHIIITAGGKNLTPANIEKEIKGADPMIGNVLAHGDRRAYVTALLTLGASESIDYATHKNMIGKSEAETLLGALLENPLARPPALNALMKRVSEDAAVRERVVEAVRRANKQLSRVESVRRIYLLDRELSGEEDELTPTLKVKRKNIEKKFADVFDRLYADRTFGLSVEGQDHGEEARSS